MARLKRSLITILIFAFALEFVQSVPAPPNKGTNGKPKSRCNQQPRKPKILPGQNNATNQAPGPSGFRPPFDPHRRPVVDSAEIPPAVPSAWAKPLNMDPAQWKPPFEPHRRPVVDTNEIDPNTPVFPLKRDFDRFVLVQSWRRSACAKFNGNTKLVDSDCKTCNITGECGDWSLHGLWPSGQISTLPPEFCDSAVQFNSKDLKSSLKKRMTDHFSNVFHGYKNDETFWRKQWEKHGTCAAQLPWLDSPTAYFTKILDLYDAYKVKTLLTKANIHPMPTVPHLINSVHEKLSKQLKEHKAKITCIDGTDTEGQTTKLINEVHICFSKYFQLEDCPGANHPSCGRDRIKYY